MQQFNRIICVVKLDDKLQNCLKYELTPIFLSLFDEVPIRKTQKAVLFEIIESATGISPQATYPAGRPIFYIIDGGFLLWSLAWQSGSTYL